MKLATRRFFAAGVFLCAAAAQAQNATPPSFPAKSVKIVVSSAAGASPDAVARLIGNRLSEAWKQPVIVENRPGASGIIGNDYVAKSTPDGYTLLMATTGLIQLPVLMAKLPYDSYKDFSPVTMVSRATNLLIVNASVPVSNLKEFVEHVRANPGKFNYGTYGNGTSAHIFGETLNRTAKLDMLHTPYKSSTQLMADVLGGQLNAAFPDAGTVQGHLKSGKFKVLATTGTQRQKNLPDVPTFAELGYKGFEPYGWYGIFAPAGTPPDIVAKISAEIGRAARQPDVVAKLDEIGLQVTANQPQEFSAIMKTEGQQWANAIREGKIRID
jgi:tripartite-type tricarboxylate transporter receptor subunit TctC